MVDVPYMLVILNRDRDYPPEISFGPKLFLLNKFPEQITLSLILIVLHTLLNECLCVMVKLLNSIYV